MNSSLAISFAHDRWSVSQPASRPDRHVERFSKRNYSCDLCVSFAMEMSVYGFTRDQRTMINWSKHEIINKNLNDIACFSMRLWMFCIIGLTIMLFVEFEWHSNSQQINICRFRIACGKHLRSEDDPSNLFHLIFVFVSLICSSSTFFHRHIQK